MTTEIAEYSQTEAALADLRSRFEGVQFQVAQPKELDAARKARAEIRDYRVGLEKMRVELKAPVLERGRLLDAEARRISTQLSALEDPIDAQILAEEKRREDEKQARIRAEEARIAGINRQLDAIRQMPLGALGKTVGGITVDLVAAQDIDVEAFPLEYRQIAQQLVDEAVAKLSAMRDQRREADREQKRLAEERLQLEKDQKAERERQAAEDAAARAERDRLDNEAREARQREEAAAREEQERVAAANRAESQRLADERREIEARAAADNRARFQREISEATLIDAATDAHRFLVELGHEEALATLKLGAALKREQVPA